MTPFEITILTSIGSVLLGIGGFIRWLVKTFLPRIIDSWQKRNEALINATNKTTSVIEKIPEIGAAVKEIPGAIKSFEIALCGVEKRFVEKVEEGDDKIVKGITELKDKIFDQRLQVIEEAVKSKRFNGMQKIELEEK